MSKALAVWHFANSRDWLEVSKVVLKEVEGMQMVKESESSSTTITATTVCRQKYHPGVLLVWGNRS